MKSRRAAVVLLALVLLGGCSREVTGSARLPDLDTLLAQNRAASVAAAMEEAETLSGWRTWNPCGFLDPAAPAGLGASAEIRGADDPAACYLDIREADFSIPYQMSVVIGFPGAVPGPGDTTRMVDGTTVILSQDDPESCAFSIVLSATRELRVGLNTFAVAETAEPCLALEPFVVPAVAALDSPPEWGADDSAVLSADPCAALLDASLGTPQVLSPRLHSCEVAADGRFMSVQLSVGPPGGDPDDTDTTVAGFDAVYGEPSLARGCAVAVSGREPVNPLTTPAPEQPYVGRVVVTVTDDEQNDGLPPDCTDAVSLADTVVTATGLT